MFGLVRNLGPSLSGRHRHSKVPVGYWMSGVDVIWVMPGGLVFAGWALG